MIRALVRLFLYRFLGARIVLGLTIIGWIRRFLAGRSGRAGGRDARRSFAGRGRSAYQPSQGSSQIVQRDPR